MTLGSIIIFTGITSIILINCFDKYIWRLGKEEEEEDEDSGKGILESENDYTHPVLLRSEDDPYKLQ